MTTPHLPPLSRSTVAPRGSWLVAIAMAVTACLPARLEFKPTPGPPACVPQDPKYQQYAAECAKMGPAWLATHEESARLAKAIDFGEDEPALVRYYIRMSVRALAEREGCLVDYESGEHREPFHYSIECGDLEPEVEVYRAKLEKAVIEYFPRMQRIPQPQLGGLIYGDAVFSYENVALGTVTTTEDASGKHGSGRCGRYYRDDGTMDVRPACKIGCERNNAAACAVLARFSPDVAVQHDAGLRECELRPPPARDPTMIGNRCGSLVDELWKANDQARARSLLRKLCTAAPASMWCAGTALKYSKNPLYDPALAAEVARKIDEASLDESTVTSLVKGAFLFDTRAPHYREEAARRTLDSLDAACRAGAAMPKGSTPVANVQRTIALMPCGFAEGYFASGPLADPAKLKSLSEAVCASAGPEDSTCVSLKSKSAHQPGGAP